MKLPSSAPVSSRRVPPILGERSVSPSSAAAANARNVARGGLVQLLGQGSYRVLSVVFIAVAFRVLGPAAFGLYRQVTQVLLIAGQVAAGGFQFATLRHIAQARAQGNPGGVRGATRVGLLGAVVLSTGVLIGILVGADALAGLFADAPSHVSDTARLFRVGAIYVPLVAIAQVLTYATMASRSMGPSVMVNDVIQPAALFAISVGFLIAGFGVEGLVISAAVSAGIALVAAMRYWWRDLSPAERNADAEAQPGLMVRFALPMAGAKLLSMRTVAPGILILGMTRSDAEVGMFALAISLQTIARFFSQALLNIWTATVADLHGRGETGQLKSLYQTINRWSATYSFPIIAALVIQPETFVHIFGGSFMAQAAVVTSILAVGTLFSVGTGPCATLVSMTGRPAVNLVNSIGAMVLYVGGAVFVVPGYGIVGMAVVDAGVTALINVCRVIQAKVLVGIQPYGRSFLKPVYATLVAAGVLLAWKLVPVKGTVTGIVGLIAAGASYLLVLRKLGIDPEERFVYERAKGRLVRMVSAARTRSVST